jgi:hypothetical protein
MMSVTVIAVALGCFSLMALYFCARGHCKAVKTLTDLEGRTIPIDLVAFQKLMDPHDRVFLRQSLPKRTYRRIQRKRNLASMSYVRCAAQNAAILIRVGESLRDASDLEVRTNAARLTESAIHLRFLAVAALLKLSVAVLFPDLELSVATLTNRYSRMVESVQLLTRLTTPVLTSRVMASL